MEGYSFRTVHVGVVYRAVTLTGLQQLRSPQADTHSILSCLSDGFWLGVESLPRNTGSSSPILKVYRQDDPALRRYDVQASSATGWWWDDRSIIPLELGVCAELCLPTTTHDLTERPSPEIGGRVVFTTHNPDSAEHGPTCTRSEVLLYRSHPQRRLGARMGWSSYITLASIAGED
jgi:hypothetical protein